MADVHTGRYKAICFGVALAGIAHIIQIISAIPSILQKGSSHAAPPFIIGLLVLAFGAAKLTSPAKREPWNSGEGAKRHWKLHQRKSRVTWHLQLLNRFVTDSFLLTDPTPNSNHASTTSA